MDIIRRNTDYAMRLAAVLVQNYNKQPISARQLAETCDVPYELACKLLQKLSSAKIAKSTMGAAGGFELAAEPKNFSLYQVIKAVQSNICLNRCVPDAKKCPCGQKCKIRKNLIALQKYINEYFKNIKLCEIQ